MKCIQRIRFIQDQMEAKGTRTLYKIGLLAGVEQIATIQPEQIYTQTN